MPDHTLLLFYVPPDKEVLSDIWLLPPPYEQVVPFREHDARYAYSDPRWSPDGQWITYVRTSVTQPISSLWISRPDQSLARQIGVDMQRGPLPPGIPAIAPSGWSLDGQEILLSLGDDLYSLNIETGQKELLDFSPGLVSVGLPPASAYSRKFNAKTNQFLLIVYPRPDDDQHVFLVTAPGQFDQMTLLNPPGDYSPVGAGGFGFLPSEVALSPDGRFLLVADYEEHSVQERLWLVDVAKKEWRLVVSRPGHYLPNRVAWSRDQSWVAWWIEGYMGLVVVFLDTTSWEIVREYHSSDLSLRSQTIGWTTDAQGQAGFGILEKTAGRGIVLLKPEGNEKDDLELISYDQLAQQLPFEPEAWAWQP
jgi:dipeptidyl aminopeptidase/acylaminoacyl peptidase